MSRDANAHTSPIRVVIADDYEIARWGFERMCEAFPSIDCVASFDNGIDAVAYCKEHDVDILILDILMPRMNGIETSKALMELPSHPEILILTAHHKIEYLEASIQLGVKGYLLKTVSKDEIQEAIHQVHEGGYHFCHIVQGDLVQLIQGKAKLQKEDSDVLNLMTPQEFKILQQVSKGKSNKEIAQQLYVSPRTIETHKRNIRTKLGLTNGRKLFAFSLNYFQRTP
ncbi:MAG: response regulator transcription factor [Cyclobacteriaceae bacterium]